MNDLKVFLEIPKLIEWYCDQSICARYLGILDGLLGAVHSPNDGNELVGRKVEMN